MFSIIVTSIVISVVLAWVLAYFSAPGWVWSAAVGAGIALLAAAGVLQGALLITIGILFIAVAVLLNVVPLRRRIVSKALFNWYKEILPPVSQTEQEALEAGTVWWEGDLFSGRPDWNKLLAFPKPVLTAEEQAFLKGPTEALCRMVNEWEVTHELYDLPQDVWQFIKSQGFLGMIIPKKYGGLEFSAFAHSEVVMKLSSHSGTAAVSVMVPNSLGPAELLIHYGTEEQKNYYLPRLAKGLEIPCFALTGPDAGSDAGSIPDFGIVCKGIHEGKEVLGMRVTWDKRYITLGPVASLLGLAFKLYDPDHLIGAKEDIGITLAIIPTSTPGVNIGRRHLPLNGAFMNGPNSGKDVFIPMDWVIGGQARVGQGWRMLMECLAAGRSISLPAQSIAAGKISSFATGAYSRVRTQFKTSIGKFEGVEEALARIGGTTYMMDATRTMTAGAVDLGEKPSVVSAIAKYHMTEGMRRVITDAMDVHGGKGICLGPNNYLGRAHQLFPVAITVEGANILTRSMIIFGQGAIRGHPFVLKEIKAANNPDTETALREFDAALFGHMGFTISNAARSLWLGITGGEGLPVPGAPETKRYYQQMTRFTAAFGLIADISMFVLGGQLKRKEKLSARLGDILSQLYMSSCALKRYEDQGRQKADLPLLEWALHDAFFKIQIAFDGVLANFPNRFIAAILRRLIFPKGLTLTTPSDKMGGAVAKILIEPNAARDRLTQGIYVSDDESNVIGGLQAAFIAVVEAEAIETKIRMAAKSGELPGHQAADQIAEALTLNVITPAEAEILRRAQMLKQRVIMVDDFPKDFGKEQAAHKPVELVKSAVGY
ncbi:MAG: acyl-CoA dehydrogenase [Burkholderiales bacterium]